MREAAAGLARALTRCIKERFVKRNGPVPCGKVIEVRYVDGKLVLDKLVTKSDSQRLKSGPQLVIRANAVRTYEKDEIRNHRGSVGRLRHLNSQELAGDGEDHGVGPRVDHR
jgi:hypothetical protein